MFAYELEYILQRLLRFNSSLVFLGIFDIDEIKTDDWSDNRDWFLVIHTGETEHWVGIWFQRTTRRINFLDSAGRDLAFYSRKLAWELLREYGNVFHLPYAIQSDGSLLCGGYLIYFVWRIVSGEPDQSIHSLYSSFKSNTRGGNDRLLSDWLKNYLTPNIQLSWI